MSKVAVSANGNTLVVDGERYTCGSREQAMSLCEAMSTGGFHIEDETYAKSVVQTSVEEVQVTEVARKSYLDHFAASPQEEAECLACLSDILAAESQEERDEAIAFYTESGAYPGLAMMAVRAMEGLRRTGNVKKAAEVINGISEYLPEVFSVMQRVYAA